MYELPAPDYVQQARTRVRSVPRFSLLFLFWMVAVLGGGAYWFLRHHGPDHAATTHDPRIMAALPVRADLGRHLARAAASANRTEAGIRQTEEQVRRTLALTDNPTEVRHLHAALADLEAAHQSLLANRDELDSANSLMKGKTE